MPERKASADVFWRSKEGFEMHLQLGGTSSKEVLDEAHGAIGTIVDTGGVPRPTNGAAPAGGAETPSSDNPPECSVCERKMTYREGESRAGNPYKGFFCPESDCEGKPVWIND